MKRKILALCLGSSMIFAGCAARVKNVTNLPPGVTLQQAQNWDSAVANLHKIASVVSTLRQSLVDLHKGGVLSDVYYSDALRIVGNIDRLELSAEIVLRGSPQNFSLSTKQQVGLYVQQISAEIQTLNAAGVTGIKNQKSLTTINTLLSDLTSIVGLILSL
jgi:PBP1b-binding outer membrane lipoprotein LpoB